MKRIHTVLKGFLLAGLAAGMIIAGPVGCDRQSRAGQEAEEAAERLGDELGNILNEAN